MTDMTRHTKTTIRYDGSALSGHEMDVQDLAPALLALAEIIQIANKKFNGDNATIKVLVDADVEQKCFQLDLSLVQSLFDQASTFLGHKDIATAKEIAEWIGIIGSPLGGLFALYKKLHKKDVSSKGITLRAGDISGTTIINISGDHNDITISDQTARLAADPEVSKRVKAVLKPLQKEGYDDLTFLHDDNIVTKINKDEAKAIISNENDILAEDRVSNTSNIRGLVRIKSPQYEGGAKWSLLWNGRAIDAEMAEEAAEWVKDFQKNLVDAPPNTVLDVTMTETVRLNEQGLAISKPTYIVSKVHQTTPPPTQIGLFTKQ